MVSPLFERADFEKLSRNAKALFEALETTDFEVVIAGLKSIYLVRFGAHPMVRRVEFEPDGTVVLAPDNPSYKTYRVSGKDSPYVVALGRPVWVGQRL